MILDQSVSRARPHGAHLVKYCRKPLNTTGSSYIWHRIGGMVKAVAKAEFCCIPLPPLLMVTVMLMARSVPHLSIAT